MMRFDPDNLDAFRAGIRQWLSDTLPRDWKEDQAIASPQAYYDFQKWWMAEKDRVGLATPNWPERFGGAGLSLVHETIIADEFARASAPSAGMFLISLTHVPATLLEWGTAEQCEQYLPGIRRGDVWCQGFSEPNAGSDLASLKTSATRDGDSYVINGQKIWSSNSMYADYCILLVRTDSSGKKHNGITFLIMDMKSPGIEVRPIRQANRRAEFGEIFLTDVRVPVANRIGPEHDGWRVAQSTLAAERGVIAFENAERQRYGFEGVLRDAVSNQASWLGDRQLSREFIQLFAEMQAGRRLVRSLLNASDDRPVAPTTPAYIKLSATVLRQRFAELLLRVNGLQSQFLQMGVEDCVDEPMFEYITSFGGTIAAGSSEIMRNIISERGLGLPR